MDSGCHNGNGDAAQTPTTLLTHKQQKQNSNPTSAAAGPSVPELARYGKTHQFLHEPQTVFVQERFPAAGGATTFTQRELASAAPAEKGPLLEGLEADIDVKSTKNMFSIAERNARSASLQQQQQQQRQVLSTLAAFPAATLLAQEATSKVGAEPMASAPAAYHHLEEVSTGDNTKNQVKDIAIQKGFCCGPATEIPSAALFAATSQLYHSNSTTPALRISAAAHFMNLTLQASPGKVATWKDICSWGALYGFSTQDLSAAVGLMGSEGIISMN